ncbi:hypothetical protein KEM54_003828 [Ascosphaera aggregata]|nr:hypothetical protein KEM54_003828 [Ascosphaera aggregata]
MSEETWSSRRTAPGLVDLRKEAYCTQRTQCPNVLPSFTISPEASIGHLATPKDTSRMPRFQTTGEDPNVEAYPTRQHRHGTRRQVEAQSRWMRGKEKGLDILKRNTTSLSCVLEPYAEQKH